VVRLITIDDLDDDEIRTIVRLGLRLHEHPTALADALAGRVVGLIEQARRGGPAKPRLRAAAARIGAQLVTLDDVSLIGAREGDVETRVADARACVLAVANASVDAIQTFGRQTSVPLFNACTEPSGPWVVLADAVAVQLATARHARAAVDGIEELREEAMVPVAAVVLAVLAGAELSPSDVGAGTGPGEPSHWFG
jgi:ornithine carbamoyltransferase